MVDGGEPGVDSRDEGKHTGVERSVILEKMMWMSERIGILYYSLMLLLSSRVCLSVCISDRCHAIAHVTVIVSQGFKTPQTVV